MKKNTERLTKESEQKFRSYCEYEQIVFINKKNLESNLKTLGIKTSIASLLRSGIIESIYKGKIYRLSGKNGMLSDLLSEIFDKSEAFYISGVYAYNRYGFIDQLPSVYQIANRKLQADKTIAGLRFQFRKVGIDYFYGIDPKTLTMTRERTLVEFCRSYGYNRFMEALNANISSINLDMLTEFAVLYPLNNVSRRLIYGLNTIRPVSYKILKKLNCKSLITLTEGKSRKGKIDQTFNIIINQ